MDRNKRLGIICCVATVSTLALIGIGVLTVWLVSGGARKSPTVKVSAPSAVVVVETDEQQQVPSFVPTDEISSLPSTTTSPSTLPSDLSSQPPSEDPTSLPSAFPSTSLTPSTSLPTTTVFPSSSPSDSSGATFYAIADVPYNNDEMQALPKQLVEIGKDAEFLVHLGDIRSAGDGRRCRNAEYAAVADLLKTYSRVPVFIVLGDNEWNDCPNTNEGWELWQDHFLYLDQYWNHSFGVVRMPGRQESFAFWHKTTLFVGLNLVGGAVHNRNEWSNRLSTQAAWTTGLLTQYKWNMSTVVLFGHANPSDAHADFFQALRDYIRSTLPRHISVLYLNGDAHVWDTKSDYFGQPNFRRIQLTGGTTEPPLQITVDPTAPYAAEDAFVYDRRLEDNTTVAAERGAAF